MNMPASHFFLHRKSGKTKGGEVRVNLVKSNVGLLLHNAALKALKSAHLLPRNMSCNEYEYCNTSRCTKQLSEPIFKRH